MYIKTIILLFFLPMPFLCAHEKLLENLEKKSWKETASSVGEKAAYVGLGIGITLVVIARPDLALLALFAKKSSSNESKCIPSQAQ